MWLVSLIHLIVKKKEQVKQTITAQDVEIIVALKCLSNFWRTLRMPLINCEINLFLGWSANCV